MKPSQLHVFQLHLREAGFAFPNAVDLCSARRSRRNGNTGQTTSGSIAGGVVDQQSSAVPGAMIQVKDDTKGFTQSTATDREGRFVFPQLSPGTYTLTIESKGFKRTERTNLELVANDKLALGTITLEVGAVTDTVTVTAEATLVQSESAERSLAIEGETLRSIAVNGRGFTPLASIVPGIIFNTNNGSSDAITNIFANGLRSSANNLTIDGISIIDTGNNGTLLSLNLDSVAEFKVLTSNYQAEYGRSAGAQISAVTRGGTRDFHGSAYAFRRHDGMNANTWLNNRDSTATNKIGKPRLDQRDLGFTIGGPVYIPKVFNTSRQKLFFFYSHEDQKRFIPPTGPTRVTVPTAAERAGDFSKTVDNSGNPFPYIRDYTTGLPCTSTSIAGCFQDGGILGKIPTSRLYGLGLNILKMYPLPNATGVGYNYSTEQASSQPQRQDLIRVDYNLSSKWRVYGRYIKVKNDQVLPYGSFVLGTNMPDFNVLLPNPRTTYAISVTGSLSPTTILEATIGGSHNSIDINPSNTKFNRAGLGLTGIPVIYPSAVKIDSPPQFVFGGRIANAPNIGSNNSPFYNFNTNRDWSATISKVAAQHSLKAGIFWQNSFKPQSSFANNNGQYNFTDNASNPLDTGFGFANAALGIYNQFTQASGYYIGNYRYNNVEFFAQDNWKVSSRLTLDYGMRFYWIQPQHDEALQTANFLPDKFNKADAPRLYRPVCIGNSAPCSGTSRRAVDPSAMAAGFVPTADNTIDGAYIGRIVPNTGKLLNGVFQAGNGIEAGLFKNRGIMFAPRFGFAYDLKGDQSIVVRGGGGMFYDRPQGNVVFDLLGNPPTTLSPTFFFGQMQTINTGQVLLAPPALVAYDHEGKSPTSYSFNMGVQMKLPLDSVLDVSYVGTLGAHLLQRRNINAPVYGAAYQAGESGSDAGGKQHRGERADGGLPAALPGLREHLLYRVRFELELSLAADFAQSPVQEGPAAGHHAHVEQGAGNPGGGPAGHQRVWRAAHRQQPAPGQLRTAGFRPAPQLQRQLGLRTAQGDAEPQSRPGAQRLADFGHLPLPDGRAVQCRVLDSGSLGIRGNGDAAERRRAHCGHRQSGVGNEQRSVPPVQRRGIHHAGTGKFGAGIGPQFPVPLADQQLGYIDVEGVPV